MNTEAKIKIQIKSIFGKLLFEFEKENNTIAKTVEEAVKQKTNLSYADLRSANLSSADLGSADLSYADLSYADLSYADLNSADLNSANLSSANLRSANLSYADLGYANLIYADLNSANLIYANLSSANLRSADLNSANLIYANLSSANLRSADLNSADLIYANLSSANLRSANLRSADLNSADLSYADLNSADLRYWDNSDFFIARTRILPEGDIIGYKKCIENVIVKLLIPADAKRSHAFGRKCRAEFAKVMEISDGKDVAYSEYNRSFEYRVGEIVRPTNVFSENWLDECAPGIHFFITRIEAEKYYL